MLGWLILSTYVAGFLVTNITALAIRHYRHGIVGRKRYDGDWEWYESYEMQWAGSVFWPIVWSCVGSYRTIRFLGRKIGGVFQGMGSNARTRQQRLMDYERERALLLEKYKHEIDSVGA